MINTFQNAPRRNRERGNAIVELSFLLPILVSLFLGTWFLGYDNYIYARLEEAIRSGARYASHGVYQTSDPSAYQTSVKNAVVYGDPAGGTTPLVPNLTTAMVNVTLSPAIGTPTSVTVSISNFQLWGPFGNNVLLDHKPWLTLPFMGYYVPL